MPNFSNITRPILVIGPGRSGSSWLVHALNQHPDVHALIENRLVDGLFSEVFESWWAPQWHWVCDERGLMDRAVQVARHSMTVFFPSNAKFWVMKAIWKGRPWDFYREVFPQARYIHTLRSPTTAAPSMMEYLGEKNQVWTKLAHVEEQYIAAHREALAVRDAGLPYLAVRQEDMASKPAEVWTAVREFCELPEVKMKNLDFEINAADSTRGHVREGREPMPWSRFSTEMAELCEELGYSTSVDEPAPAASQ
ncbi:MAG: sulfotransferase family protein [Phycisphaerales bacterium]